MVVLITLPKKFYYIDTKSQSKKISVTYTTIKFYNIGHKCFLTSSSGTVVAYLPYLPKAEGLNPAFSAGI